MKILLYSNASYILDELKKVPKRFQDLLVISSFENLEETLKIDKKKVILHHIDDFPEDTKKVSELLKTHPKLSLIAFENQPNELKGCGLLKLGYKSYLHTFSNCDILNSAIDSVGKGNIYVYPKLMQFLVSQVPVAIQENKNLKSLTPKELNVLKLISKGYSNAKIAQELDIAEVTVKKHVGSMFEKLKVKDRLSLALILK